MKSHKKVITAIVALSLFVCSCVLVLWLWPYICYTFLVSSAGHAARGRMHCWVRVVDQNGIGVKGYRCRVLQEHASWWPFSKNEDIVTVVKSGENGVFEFKSKGSTGRVFFGYSWKSQWKLNPDQLMQRDDLSVYTYKLRQAQKKNPINYLGSRNNPFLLHVFSLGQPQKLLYWDKKVHLEEKQDWLCVDVLSGRVWESGVPRGDIAVRYNELTKENISAHCMQSFVAGKDCGIAPVDDDWGLRAPKGGYRAKLCGDRDWTGGHMYGIDIYYRLFRRGYIYGRLDLGGSGQLGGGVIKAYTNLEGKRNLYFNGYEASINDPWSRHIKNVVSPPVNPAELFRAVAGKKKNKEGD